MDPKEPNLIGGLDAGVIEDDGCVVGLSDAVILELSARDSSEPFVAPCEAMLPSQRQAVDTEDVKGKGLIKEGVGFGVPAESFQSSRDSDTSRTMDMEDGSEQDPKSTVSPALATALQQSLAPQDAASQKVDLNLYSLHLANSAVQAAPVASLQFLSLPGAFRQGSGICRDDMEHRRSDNSLRNSGQLSIKDGMLVTATMVEDDLEAMKVSIRNQVREELLQSVVQVEQVQVQVVDSGSEVVDSDPTTTSPKPHQRWHWLVCLAMLLVVIIVAIAVGISVGKDGTDDEETSTVQVPTDDEETSNVQVPTMGNPNIADQEIEGSSMLERIRKRGHVKCGASSVGHGLGFNPKDGSQQGMTIEQCQAIALVALGDSSLYQLTIVDSKSRFPFLHNHSYDVLTTTATHTMGRDISEPSAGATGLSFSTPYLYDGMAFGGVPEFVDCADSLDTISGNCRNLRVCVTEGSSHVPIVNKILPAAYVIRSASKFQIDMLNNGTCNVMVRDSVSMPEARVRANGYDESMGYKLGSRMYSREPLALVTRQEDPEWTSLVDSVVELFYHAEAINLTSEDAQDLLDNGHVAPLDMVTFGNNDLYDRMVRIVAEFGNYAELYERTLEHLVPRDYPNYLHKAGEDTSDYNRSSGLLYYFPFGNLDAIGPDPLHGKTLDQVSQRGFLICGVRPRPGFAEYDLDTHQWSGLDVEFCKALNAAIHMGDTGSVQYVDVGTNENHTLASLQSNEVDVVAGERITLQKSLVSNVVFSSPYFYDNQGEAFAFATQPNDPQWSGLVFWVVMATIYAEEEGVTMEALVQEPSLMPSVSLFGERLKLMLYDCISQVGNYGEIYERSLQALVPRNGGNLLNEDLSGPQQFAYPIK